MLMMVFLAFHSKIIQSKSIAYVHFKVLNDKLHRNYYDLNSFGSWNGRFSQWSFHNSRWMSNIGKHEHDYDYFCLFLPLDLSQVDNLSTLTHFIYRMNGTDILITTQYHSFEINSYDYCYKADSLTPWWNPYRYHNKDELCDHDNSNESIYLHFSQKYIIYARVIRQKWLQVDESIPLSVKSNMNAASDIELHDWKELFGHVHTIPKNACIYRYMSFDISGRSHERHGIPKYQQMDSTACSGRHKKSKLHILWKESQCIPLIKDHQCGKIFMLWRHQSCWVWEYLPTLVFSSGRVSQDIEVHIFGLPIHYHIKGLSIPRNV